MAEETVNNKEVEEGKVCAILAWLFPIGLIWYFVDEKMKKNSFARFHVQQSLVLAILSIALGVLSMLIPMVLFFLLPVAFLIMIVFWVIYLGIFVLWIIGIIGAISGTQKELPIIGKYGNKLNL